MTQQVFDFLNRRHLRAPLQATTMRAASRPSGASPYGSPLPPPPPARLRLYDDDSADVPAQRAIALLISVCAAQRCHPSAKYFAMALLADRALPLLQSPDASGGAPPVMPLALSCVMVAMKCHERTHPLISQLLQTADACSPGFSQRVQPSAVAAAELWLVTVCSISAFPRLASEYCAELIASMCAPCTACSRAPHTLHSADVLTRLSLERA
jgi:hypothetical protein